MIKYQAKIFRDGKRYSVIFPDLPGCFSDGKNLEDALISAREALSLHLEEARNPKWAVPKPVERKGTHYYWITPHEDVAVPLMVRQARLKHGLTQGQMAARLDISIQQLQKLETPGKSNPTVRTLVAITKVLQEDLEIRLSA
jgi:predicted RNase H-like HicB family nuclease/DNA-binding XRE family transcriptional regulator